MIMKNPFDHAASCPLAPVPARASLAANPVVGPPVGEVTLTMLASVTTCVINASRYHVTVLRSFKDRDTEAIWRRQRSRLLDGPTQRVAWRKLALLDAAETLADLRVPPGNRLEKLRGDREGQHSIRISQQWRICFSWSEAGREDVEIVDYH